MYAVNMPPENIVRGIKWKDIPSKPSKLSTMSLAEFMPELWDELSKLPPSHKIIAVRVFQAIRTKVEGV